MKFKTKELEALVKSEGDFKSFKYKGFNCYIKRNKFTGALNGYIQIEKDSPHYNSTPEKIEAYYQNELPSHAILNFASLITENCFMHEHLKNDVYLIGFDCDHCFDANPYDLDLGKDPNAVYRTMAYVEQTLKNMVDFMIQYEN